VEAEAQSQQDVQKRQEAEEARRNAEDREREAREAADAATQARAEAEAARQALQQQQQAAQAEAERQRLAANQAEQARQQAEQEKEALRARLLDQLNKVLETRDTARGLIVNMSDVLFDSGKYTLRPAAREKLAKISGIVSAYPELHLAVEGHTDNVGGDAYNQRLSEQRATSVKDYLIKQGVPDPSVTAQGFGKTQPVAPNTTAKGRQLNRRVELVVSGEVIGTQIGSVRTQPATTDAPNPRQ
jgi:outer membrane protein OmpA-like peptidoglycan-associated protein